MSAGILTTTTQEHYSQVKPTMKYDSNHWLVSLVNLKASEASSLHGHAVIVVEGVEDGKPLFRAYDIIRGKIDPVGQSSWIQRLMGNETSVIGDIREFRKNDRNYSAHDSAQWYAPPVAVAQMISMIHLHIHAFQNAKLNGTVPQQFKFQTAGSGRLWILGGNGGENCVTWAEKQLVVAGIGNRAIKVLDSIKASPALHAKFTDSKFLKLAVGLTAVALIGLKISKWK